MRKPLFFLLFLFLCTSLHAQYIYPVVNANFGADAELIANSCKKDSVVASDDWFSDGTNKNITGAGTFIIDTTGAAAMAARYAIDPAYRKLPFYRPMRFPSYSLLLNRMLIDGVLIRDYHGPDSTTFTTGSKNGMSPADWTAPVEQSVPDKNDIEDMFVHVRRSGPTTSYDLWLFGGISIIGITGNRYFDFEMYQTDIFYSRASRKFINYGPDEGHTSWTFDAQGNILKPGDIIFTAEYSTASLTFIEARIWVNKNDLNITPAAFNWAKDGSGNFIYDGASASSQYVYASIRPKTTGSFYSGVQSSAGTWAGPFKFLDAGNNILDNFTGGEFLEFSVNLTKLGLDPVTLLGGSACGLPFRRILAKTRTSTSFSSSLKDFVGPFDFFLSPEVEAAAETSILCTTNGISKINVLNPYATSVYTWSTPDGNILTRKDSTSIYVNSPGTYIVNQQLMNGCGVYASDTINIIYDPHCTVLDSKDIRLNGNFVGGKAALNWASIINGKAKYYEVQRSFDGKTYQTIAVVTNADPNATQKAYSYGDGSVPADAQKVFYRIRAVMDGSEFTSTPLQLQLPYSLKLSVYPNPAFQKAQISIFSDKQQNVDLSIVSAAGKTVYWKSVAARKGENVINLDDIGAWTPGMYIVRIASLTDVKWQKIIIQNRKF
ncbi:T9SS type A sorting domain-containing protein [Chitinophagaceae bacterium LB-8]|uniref:T9SS type A sorting domain-containing protein n=1 Tax=Paraflavisolibacter caeni TaxID=2982496 RepID=A0A9X2XS45_9BACT|nr:T9SS type A sorting domain-containing protein [Paraflavisolibacter caeni]MCU7547510.1 T9SS type A sorting domain-containing protein [Paraflavisolibacter caeni]